MAKNRLSPKEIFERDHGFQKPEELQLEILYQMYRLNDITENIKDNLKLIVNVFIVIPLILAVLWIVFWFLNQ